MLLCSARVRICLWGFGMASKQPWIVCNKFDVLFSSIAWDDGSGTAGGLGLWGTVLRIMEMFSFMCMINEC